MCQEILAALDAEKNEEVKFIILISEAAQWNEPRLAVPSCHGMMNR